MLMTRRTLGALLALSVSLFLAACSPDETTTQAPTGANPDMAMSPTPHPAMGQPQASARPYGTNGMATGDASSTAGLSWSVPEQWQIQGQRPMRAATYSTAPADGDSDRGEIAVFYFGPDQGGTVGANVDRWFQQFDQDDGRPTHEVAERERIEVNGIPVTLVRASGSYNAAAGPMAPRADVRPGYSLIGAIVEGPEGAVFFKFTGPQATVHQEEERFLTMIDSVSAV